MAEGITLKRIIDMDEAAELTSSDYALVDSATGGPKKFALGNELSSLKEDLTNLYNLDFIVKGNEIGIWVSGTTVASNGAIGTSSSYSACDVFLSIPKYAKAIDIYCKDYNGYIGLYTSNEGSGTASFIKRVGTYAARRNIISLDRTEKYIRCAIRSTTISDAQTLSIKWITEIGDAIELIYNPNVEKHKNSLGAMLQIAETYFNAHYSGQNPFTYESQRNLFANAVKASNGDFSMTCSGLVEACLMGVPFEYSRYLTNENQKMPWGFRTDGSGDYANDPISNPDSYMMFDYDPYTDYMLTGQLAKFLEDSNNLSPVDVNRLNLHEGDLLFYVDGSGDTSHDSEDDDIPQEGDSVITAHYRNISHVAICAGVSKDRYRLIESVSPTYPLVMLTRTYTPKSWGELKYVSKNPIEAEYSTTKVYENNDNYTGTVSGTTGEVVAISFTEPLTRGFYTVCVADSGNCPMGMIWVLHSGESSTTDGTRKIAVDKRCGVVKYIFYATEPVYKLNVRMVKGSDPNTTYNYDVNNIKVYKGYYPD